MSIFHCRDLSHPVIDGRSPVVSISFVAESAFHSLLPHSSIHTQNQSYKEYLSLSKPSFSCMELLNSIALHKLAWAV